MSPVLDIAHRRGPAALGLGAFTLYAFAAPGGPYWLDSQELGSAAVQLGVPHPTGFPIICLLGRIASLVPVGELAYRVHLLSAVCGAIAVAMVARLVMEIIGDDDVAVIGGVAAGVVLATGATFFRQATVTEVYAPTAMLLTIGVRLAVRVADPKTASALPLTGLSLFLLAGIGAVGVHASFRFLLLPLAIIWILLLIRRHRWARVAVPLALLGAVGTAIYLPIRSAAGPETLDWGHPSSIGALWDHLNAARIRAAYGGEMFATGAGAGAGAARTFATQITGDLGVVASLLAAGGLVALLWRRQSRAAGLVIGFVLLADAAYSIWINPMGLTERQNGVPFAVAAAALAGVGLAAGARRLGRRAAPYAAAVVAIVAAVEPSMADWPARLAATRTDAPRAWAEAALAQAPPGAIVLVQSDSLASNLFWLSLVENARPDVAVLVRQHAWDRRRTIAVLRRAGIANPDLEAQRPRLWEVGVDTPPPDLAPSVPLGTIGGTVSDLNAAFARLGDIFTDRATADPNARRTAVRAYTNLGTFFAAARDLRGAARATDQAVLLDERHLTALVNGARYHMALNDDPAATAFAYSATQLDPSSADAWALLGTLDARAHRCPQARAHLDRALAIDPAHPDASVNRPLLDSICP